VENNFPYWNRKTPISLCLVSVESAADPSSNFHVSHRRSKPKDPVMVRYAPRAASQILTRISPSMPSMRSFSRRAPTSTVRRTGLDERGDTAVPVAHLSDVASNTKIQAYWVDRAALEPPSKVVRLAEVRSGESVDEGGQHMTPFI
jgi:hypothetical protein